jgi:dTDP-glucose pyrophosphorylase
MPSPLEACLVPEGGTIREAMVAIDRAAGRLALAVDVDGRLVGVATDGDIRRALLRGHELDDPIAAILTRQYISIDASANRNDALEFLRARRIAAVPVIDADHRPVGLHLVHDFVDRVERSNWAVVMAGGRGVRLRPLTETVPKPMLRVAGRPILERIVLHLVGFGIKRIFLSVNYLSEQIEDHFGDGQRFGCRIDYLREDAPLGTAGALGLLPERPVDPFLLMNGDLVTSADLGGLLDQHVASGACATIGIRRYLHTVPFGCVERDGDRVTRLDEKPTLSREVNSGIYALDPSVLELVPADRPASTPELIAALLDRGDLVEAFEIEDDWIDVGQREQLAAAREGEHP